MNINTKSIEKNQIKIFKKNEKNSFSGSLSLEPSKPRFIVFEGEIN